MGTGILNVHDNVDLNGFFFQFFDPPRHGNALATTWELEFVFWHEHENQLKFCHVFKAS